MSLNPIHAFLIQSSTLLHRHGTPSHRLERVMVQVARSLGVEGVFLYTPTALVISITDSDGEHTYLRRVDSGAVDIDKLIHFDETLDEVEAGRMDVAQASLRLSQISQAAPPYASWVTIAACGISCAVVAVLFRGGVAEIVSAGALGLLMAMLEVVHGKRSWEPGFLEPLSGFLAAVGALAIAQFIIPIDDRLVTLAALIIMIPGLKLTVAFTELAVGHLSAGVARLAGAGVSLLTITVGVALGWRLAGGWRQLPDELHFLPVWAPWLAIAVAPITFAIVFRARWPQWPVIVAVTISGFVASTLAGSSWGSEVGAFLGATVVGIGSNLYARLRDHPALVPLTPGIIVLVPGSMGYRSLTAFIDRQTVLGIDFAFAMLMVAMSLVGGIMTANAILPPKRIL
jgi:uncharacterized membrane protein YjjP (DUF1212 family)